MNRNPLTGLPYSRPMSSLDAARVAYQNAVARRDMGLESDAYVAECRAAYHFEMRYLLQQR